MNLKPIREDRPLDYPNGYLLLPEDIKKKETIAQLIRSYEHRV